MAKKSAKRKPAKQPTKKAGGPTSSKVIEKPIWMECEEILESAFQQIRGVVLLRIHNSKRKYRDNEELADIFDEGLTTCLEQVVADKLDDIYKEAGELVPYYDEEDENKTPEERKKLKEYFDDFHRRLKNNDPEFIARLKEIEKRQEAELNAARKANEKKRKKKQSR
jgi:hypothetical protein